MLTFIWFMAIGMMWMLFYACPRGPRVKGQVSWFVILPQMMPATKKAKGRMQQKRKRK